MKALSHKNPRDRAVGMRRLQKLVDLLFSIPAERFDFETWAGTEEKPFQGHANLSCGTVACALGWATTIPCLRDKRRAALRLETDGGIGLVKNDNGNGGVEAGEDTFALTNRESTYLFTANNQSYDYDNGWKELPARSWKDNRDTVATRIQAFINAGGILGE